MSSEQDLTWKNRKKHFRFFSFIERIPFWMSLIALLTTIIDFGFDQPESIQYAMLFVYNVTIGVGVISIIARYILKRPFPKFKVWIIDGIILFALLTIFFNAIFGWKILVLQHRELLYIGSFLVFIREFSALQINFSRRYLNPAQLFILSFISIILIGSFLLLLPNATHEGISYIDALFTSTSAVCVTGLVVVDTGSYFTTFGQFVILILIQLGGIGIMTFTSYFSYFFRGGSSYETQLLLKDMTNAQKIAEVFSILKKIILLTFAIELLGAIMVYSTLDPLQIPSTLDQIFFSVFHSISGFCNAGFSTLTNSLYETGFRFNYSMHLILAALFIIGGIGFPIIFNSFKYLKHLVINRILPFSRKEQVIHVPWVLNINTRIVLLTTAILIFSGTVVFYIFEYDNTLAAHGSYGKLVTAFFGAVTPRTAGFNTIDTSALNFSTIMLVFLLMWIGASPGSTGGGIKTSTFAIGTLNFISLAKGKDRIELFRREVADISVRRAFAIISLSLAVIGASVFLIASFDSEMDLLDIGFECFSAYSTVGLSLGITSELSEASKMVIIFTMFIGRVSMLSILIAIFRKVKHLKYKYPTEEILIN